MGSDIDIAGFNGNISSPDTALLSQGTGNRDTDIIDGIAGSIIRTVSIRSDPCAADIFAGLVFQQITSIKIFRIIYINDFLQITFGIIFVAFNLPRSSIAPVIIHGNTVT